MKNLLRSENLRLRLLSQMALTGISAFALALCFAQPAHAANEPYFDLSDANPGSNVPLGGGNTVVDFVQAGSTIGAAFKVTGAGGLTVDGTFKNAGSNALTLNAAVCCDYTGATLLQNGGNLILGANTIATSSSVTVNSGSVLTLAAANTVNNLLGAGSVVNGGFLLTDDTTGGAPDTFSGVISGSGGLTLSGTGELDLTGDNTMTGAITLGGTSTLGIDDANTIATVSQVNMGAGTTLEFDGAFTLNRNIVQTGAATITTNGNDDTISGNITGANALTKQGAGVLTLSGTNAFTTLNVASGTVSIAADANLGTGAVTLNSTVLQVTGTGQTIDNNIVTNATGTLTLTGANSDTFSGVISGTNLITNSGTGTVTLSGNNTYTGTFTVNTGTTTLSGTNAYSGGTTINSGARLNTTVTNIGTGGVALNAGTLDLTGNAETLAQTVALTGGGTLAVSAGNVETVSGVISGAGGLNVGVSGETGTLKLSGVNTYVGGTNVNFGTLSIGAANNLGAGTVSMANGTTFATTAGVVVTNDFALTGTDTVDSGGFNDTFSGVVSGTGNLTKVGNGTLTLSGLNTFSGGITITTGGISAASGGASGSNLGTGSVSMANGTSLTLTGTTTISNALSLTGTDTIDSATANTLSGLISGTGTLTKTGAGQLTLSNTGNSAATFATTISVGGVSVASASRIGTGAVTMANGTNFTMTGSDTFTNAFALTGTDTFATGANNDTLSGAITGTGVLSKTGSGTLTLSNAGNTFSGGISVAAGGTVAAASDANLGTGTITLNAATLQLTGATTVDELIALNGGGTIAHGASADVISSVISGTGGLTTSGSNTLTLSGNNTYTGALTVGAGDTVVLSGTNAYDGGAVVNAGATLRSIVADFGTGGFTLNAGILSLTDNGNTLAQTIALSGGGTLTVATGNSDTFSGVISGTGPLHTGISGATGTVVLSGVNTYNGGTNIDFGTLSIGAANNLGTGTVAMANGTTFTTSAGITVTNAFALTGTDTIATGANNDIFSGAITGTGVLTKTGSGILTLSNGSNTYSGGTTLSAGTISVGANGNLGTGTVAMAAGTELDITGSDTFTQAFSLTGADTIDTNANNDTLSGLISGAGTLTKIGAGQLTLSNTGNSAATFATTISVGGVSVASASRIGTGAVTMANGTNFTMTGSDTFTNAFALTGTDTIATGANNDTLSGAITGTGLLSKTGSGILTLSNAGNTFSGGMNVTAGTVSAGSDANLGTGTIDLAASTELDLTGATTIDELINLSGAATVDTNANNDTVSSVISGVGLTKAGSGILTLSGVNTFTTLNVAVGTVSIGNDNNLGSGNVTLNSTELNLTGATTVNNNIVSSGGGTIDTNANNDTFSGVLSGNGFTKIGSGILTLTGVNTFTTLNVSVGTVSVGADNNLGSSTVTLNGTELDLTGAFTTDNAIALNSGGTIDTNANNDTASGVISGTGPLTKTGSGTLTLSGANTYNGGTNLNVGGLSIGAANNLGSGTVAMANNTTLTTTASVAITNAFALTGTDTIATGAFNDSISGAITGTGNLTKTGAGTLTLSNSGNTYSGGTTLSAGGLSVGANGNLGTGTVAMANNTSVTFTGSDTFTQAFALTGTDTFATGTNEDELSGLVSGTGSITKTGTGTLTLSNDNTYTGATNVNAGTLVVDGDQTAATGTTTIASGATLKGVGTLGGDLVNNGTVAVGHSPGELDVLGNYSGAGTFEAEVTGSNATPGTTFDLLNVTGTADISSQDLVINPVGAAPAAKYVRGTTYHVITAAGGLSGEFTNFADGDVVDADSTGTKQTTADNIAGSDNDLLAFKVNYDSNDVILKIVRAELFGALGETPNQVALGNALDTLQETATGDMDTLLNALSGDSDIPGALNTLTGESNANLQKSTVGTVHAFNGLLGKRLGGDCNTADYLPALAGDSKQAKFGATGSAAINSAWACGYGGFGKTRGDNNTGDIESTLAGGAFGVEMHPTMPSVVRVGVGYGRDDAELNSTGDTAVVNSVQAGVYGQHTLMRRPEGQAYVGASLSGAYNFANTERHISVGGLNRKAEGDVTGYNLSAGALVGALIPLNNPELPHTVNIEPMASLEYIFNSQASYTETGAGAANLSVSDSTSHTLRASAGGQVSTTLPVDGGMTLTPFAHAAVIYDALDVNPSLTQSIGGASFTVKGADPGRLGAQGGGGATLQVSPNVAVFGDYNGTFKEDQTNHAFMGGVKVNW